MKEEVGLGSVWWLMAEIFYGREGKPQISRSRSFFFFSLFVTLLPISLWWDKQQQWSCGCFCSELRLNQLKWESHGSGLMTDLLLRACPLEEHRNVLFLLLFLKQHKHTTCCTFSVAPDQMSEKDRQINSFCENLGESWGEKTGLEETPELCVCGTVGYSVPSEGEVDHRPTEQLILSFWWVDERGRARERERWKTH